MLTLAQWLPEATALMRFGSAAIGFSYTALVAARRVSRWRRRRRTRPAEKPGPGPRDRT